MLRSVTAFGDRVMIYLSRRDTALVASDAVVILGVSADEYAAAVSEGKLRRSIRVANDPTGRLAFHSFWDLLEFSLARSFVSEAEADDVRPYMITDLCDHLALSDEDVAVGTGDVATDLALLEEGWNDETGVQALPMNVVRHYAQLILRTLQQLHTVIRMMSAGYRTPCAVLCKEDAVSAPTMPMRLAA